MTRRRGGALKWRERENILVDIFLQIRIFYEERCKGCDKCTCYTNPRCYINNLIEGKSNIYGVELKNYKEEKYDI